MKMNKNYHESSIEELEDEKKTIVEDLFNLKFKKPTKTIDNPLRIREMRREIARVNTIIREKELKKAKALED